MKYKAIAKLKIPVSKDFNTIKACKEFLMNFNYTSTYDIIDNSSGKIIKHGLIFSL